MAENKPVKNGNWRKKVRRVFNGRILKDINWKANWKFIAIVIILIIIVINRQLSYADKMNEIDKLNKELMLSRDKAMDIKEENFNLGVNIENSLMETAEENNFNIGGYLPFVIPKISEGEEE